MRIPLRNYWRLLITYLKPQWRRALLLALLLIISIALQLVSPQLLRRFIDGAMGGGAESTLVQLAILFIAAALLHQFASAAARYVGEGVAWTATNALRADLVAHALRLDLSYHKEHTPGEMVERIDGDVSALTNFFSQFFVEVLSNLVLMAGVLALLYLEDWRVGLAMTGFVALALTALNLVRFWSEPLWLQERSTVAELYSTLEEQISAMEDLRSSGAAGYVMQRYFLVLRRLARAALRTVLAMGGMWGTSLTVFALGTAIAFSLGTFLWSRGLVTIGTVYLIFHYTELIRRPMEQIRTQLEDLQRAGAAIARVEELLRTRSRISTGGGARLLEGSLGVELRQVSFAYEEEMVLSDVSFSLRPGAVLGLLGRTGSGKSTLARILMRFYDPTSGLVLLGGVPTDGADLRNLRSRVGFVTQDVQIFSATVRENLTLFDPEIPDIRILEVLKQLGLTEWMKGLPHGLDTQLESGGSGLSAGEAQLLAFARVFLRDPGLVILDEASSRLDPATEALVERAVSRLLRGRTGIIIAHRLATVQRADQILILDDGRIAEFGARAELAADPDSRFSRLLRVGMEEVLA